MNYNEPFEDVHTLCSVANFLLKIIYLPPHTEMRSCNSKKQIVDMATRRASDAKKALDRLLEHVKQDVNEEDCCTIFKEKA